MSTNPFLVVFVKDKVARKKKERLKTFESTTTRPKQKHQKVIKSFRRRRRFCKSYIYSASFVDKAIENQSNIMSTNVQTFANKFEEISENLLASISRFRNKLIVETLAKGQNGSIDKIPKEVSENDFFCIKWISFLFVNRFNVKMFCYERHGAGKKVFKYSINSD